MKAYMAYSKYDGAQEGAILVIHHTARQAKVLAWQSGECFNVDEYLDMAIRKIDDDAMRLSRNASDSPHVEGNPAFCIACELWGCGVADYDGVLKCANCGEYPGNELIALYLS